LLHISALQKTRHEHLIYNYQMHMQDSNISNMVFV